MKNKIAIIFISSFILNFPILSAQVNIDSIAYNFGYQIDDSINNGHLDFLNNVFDEIYFTDQFFIDDTTDAQLNAFNLDYKQTWKTILLQ